MDSFKAFCLKNKFVFPQDIDVTPLFTKFASTHFDFGFCGLFSDDTFTEFCSFTSQKEGFNIFSGSPVLFDSKDLERHLSSLCSRKSLVLTLAPGKIDSLFRTYTSFRTRCCQSEIFSDKILLGFYSAYRDILSTEIDKVTIVRKNGSNFDLDPVIFLEKFTQLAKSKGFFIPNSDLLIDEFSLYLMDKSLNNPYDDDNLISFAEHLAIKTSVNLFNGKTVKILANKVKSNILAFAKRKKIDFKWTNNTLLEFQKFITLSIDFTLVKVFSATALSNFLSASHKRKGTQASRRHDNLPFINRRLFFRKTSELIKSQGFYLKANYDLFTSFRSYSKGLEDPLEHHLSSFLSCFSICKISGEKYTPPRKNNERENNKKIIEKLPFIDKRLFFKKASSIVEKQNLSFPMDETLFQNFRVYSQNCIDPFAGDNLSSFLSNSSKDNKKVVSSCLPNKSRSFQALKKFTDKGDLRIDNVMVEKFRAFASTIHSNRFYHNDTISSFFQSLKLTDSRLNNYREFLRCKSIDVPDEILRTRVIKFTKLFPNVSGENSSVIHSLHSLSTLSIIQTPNGDVNLCRLDVFEKFQEFSESLVYEEKFFDPYLEILKSGDFPLLSEDSFSKLFETIRSLPCCEPSPSMSPSILESVRDSLSSFPELNLRNLEYFVKLALGKTKYLSKSQQVSLIRDKFLGICSSIHTGPPPFPLTEPLRILATKVFETCKKEGNPAFVIEQIFYLVSLMDLPDDTDSPDVVNEVATRFLLFLGSDQQVDIDDADDIQLTQSSSISSSENLFPGFQFTATPVSLPPSPVLTPPTPRVSLNSAPSPTSIPEASLVLISDPPVTAETPAQATPQTYTEASSQLVTTPAHTSNILTTPITVSAPPLSSETQSGDSFALISEPPLTFETPAQATIQTSIEASSQLVTTPEKTSTIFSEPPLTFEIPTQATNQTFTCEASSQLATTPVQTSINVTSSETISTPSLSLGTPSEVTHPTSIEALFSTPLPASATISVAAPLLTINTELPSESDSETALNLSNNGPVTRQRLFRKFIRKMTNKERYFLKFCKAVLQACGSNKSKDNIIGQCTRLISLNCASSIMTIQSNFAVQGIIQRIVPKVISIIEENKAAPPT